MGIVITNTQSGCCILMYIRINHCEAHLKVASPVIKFQKDSAKDVLIVYKDHLDNNNCAPSFSRSLCEIGGDCFGPRYFSEEKYRGPKQSPTNSHYDRKIDGGKLLLSLITAL